MFFETRKRPPWPWALAKFCLDFRDGQPRHFPEGTYSQQMAHPVGGLELEMMELIHRVWRAFVQSGPDEWEMDGDEMLIAHWLSQPDPVDYAALNRLIWMDWPPP